MTIITAGKKYVDIDAYASMLAYKKLLNSLGRPTLALSSAELNQSIPPLLRQLSYHLDSTKAQKDADLILVDVSNPGFFDPIVDSNKITEVIDHHTGFEKYWQGQKANAQIELIGSVCTLIFEKIEAAGKQEILDADLCKLLLAGILDNTLNLRSSITTERDLSAYEKLKSLGNVDDSWRDEYFTACSAEIAKDYKSAILSDLKEEPVSPLLPPVIGQLILLNPSNIDYDTLTSIFSGHDKWLMNIIGLNDGKSYLYFNGPGVKEGLEKLFGNKARTDHLLILDYFLLRKQILALARSL